MKNKIINSLLILVSIVALAFILKSYLKVKTYEGLRADCEVKYMDLQLEVSKSVNSRINDYAINQKNINKLNSFTSLNNSNNRDRHNIETAMILYPLDSIISTDLLGKNWLQNRDKIRSIFLKASKADDSLKFKDENNYIRYDLNEIFKKDKLTFFEWSGLLDISIYYKDVMKSRVGAFCMCFSIYSVVGIPSKQIVNIGDTVFIDWINYIDTDFIPQTYSMTSNYDNYLNFESGYHHCRMCGAKENTFLLQEYQIPFSEIKKNKKWRSVFYFRNDKLEQDSVVLERELEF
ncbi:hypothetical protein Fleli_0933 [Bernardetia litoralis DSM 6794]|uniref:Uncharacterized protein n=1 Tax=Bernardetia litoralis (strain ATCC 23117 / DSM 6794 / NBRC 15988 / NCIMB 1366 / Fx l1 / Sio-4) TaxID=880071 RepID=I4AHF2_BERLS|nr:hypothetical protein [Bernardetia litoralis]AFM03387.1 hypothetical protein Fleli_0933 [Bernardetia litoralis DSM 6794]